MKNLIITLLILSIYSCTETTKIDLFSSGSSPCKTASSEYDQSYESVANKISSGDIVISTRYKSNCETGDLLLHANENKLLDLSQIANCESDLKSAMIFGDELWLTFGDFLESSLTVKIYRLENLILKEEFSIEHNIVNVHRIGDHKIGFQTWGKFLIYDVQSRTLLHETDGMDVSSGFVVIDGKIIFETSAYSGTGSAVVLDQNTFELVSTLEMSTHNPNHNTMHTDDEYIYFVTGFENEYFKRGLAKILIDSIEVSSPEEIPITGLPEFYRLNPIVFSKNMMFTITEQSFYKGNTEDGIFISQNVFPYEIISSIEIDSDDKFIYTIARSRASSDDVRLLKLSLSGDILFDLPVDPHVRKVLAL